MGFTFAEIWRFGIFGLIGEKYRLNIAVLIFGYLLCALTAYLLGSLNFGVIISKLGFGDDIRTHGSGNAGMTNMLRTYGKSAAMFTLLGDALKAVISVLAGHMIGGETGAYIAGLGCILGHVFPVYFGFKGGKGVAVTAAMVLCLDPIVFAILFVVFALIVFFTKYISLGSVMCMMIYPLVLYRISGGGFHVIIAIIIAALIIFLHRGNMNRLRLGTENKISFKKKTDKKKTESDKEK
ncbi:MAG: glycerol-3-phosphate 1-O-acyltransferase PlsY [Eubacteriales bacterium]|nr:glycerol-3-phosphate 1-O-acyltransferase PlsY [Eubacteriales bacterium]